MMMDKRLVLGLLVLCAMTWQVFAATEDINGEYSFWLENQTCKGWVKVDGDKVFESSWTIDNNITHKFEDDFTTEITTSCSNQDIVCPTVNCPNLVCPETACNCPEIDYSKFPAPSCNPTCPAIVCPECDVQAVVEDGKKLNYKDAGIGFVGGLIIGAVGLMYYLKGRYSGGYTDYSRPIPAQQTKFQQQEPGKELPRFR